MSRKPLSRIRDSSLVLIGLAGAFLRPCLCGDRADSTSSKFEALPILSYDSDTGFGYGAKVFFLNFLGWRESLDGVAFQSSKGERWYHVVVSIPDFELRQGTIYPLAVDLIVDYDRWIAYNYFGMGNRSRFEDRQIYTREPLEISLLLGRGFSKESVGQIGLRARRIVNSGLFPLSGTNAAGEGAENGGVNSLGVVFTGRYDSRDSYVASSRGTVVQLECEMAPHVLRSTSSYFRWAVWLYQFTPVDLFHSVVALRLGMESLSGDDIPMQLLVEEGGGSNLRGSVIGRYLDRVGAVANFEWRIPILWRFGAILGADAARVWSAPSKVSLDSWACNPVVGLRFSMDTFIVRADVGFGRESTGFFLNFGHLF
jgi:outer membrane protein assembly factor BamA